jgi:hypothetical protein
MQMERRQLRERREGRLRRALGEALPGESAEQLDRLGKEDQLRAEQGHVAVMEVGAKIFYKHIDLLSRHYMNARTAAEQARVEWLKYRVA